MDRSHRGDVDGLRAVAILLVVAFHVGLPAFPGGFIGVDVFFVISGYLITSHLLREARSTGHVGLVAFWGKRIRRLVPAMALMLVVVLGLAVLVVSPLDLGTIAREARAAALYVSNIAYARQATDYFGGDLDQSLFLHTWSLGVEEQFYLVWPLLFSAVAFVVRRDPARLRRVLVVGFGVTFVASLAACIALTNSSSPWAFFSLPTRAWEFAAAGLLAAWTVPHVLRHRHIQLALAVAGLALIIGADLGLSSTTPYPGWYALLPVTGTILVIVAGERAATATRPNPVSHLLAIRPAQWLGRVSYSWYLWHWPFILLATIWLESDSRRVTVTAALVSLVVAVIAHHFVENPLRFSRRLTRSEPRTYLLAVAITLLVVAASVATTRYGDRRIDTEVVAQDAGPTNASGPARLSLAELRTLRDDRYADLCPTTVTDASGIQYCQGGNPDGTRTVVLAGDSKARHWIPAFDRAAEQLDIRLVIRWLGACTSTNISIQAFKSPLCTEYQRQTDELIELLRPDAVVLSNSNSYVPDSGDPDDWGRQFHDRLASLQTGDRRVGVIADTPAFEDDPVDCVWRRRSPDRCAVPRPQAYRDLRQAIFDEERDAVAALGGVRRLDVSETLCPEDRCVVWLDGSYVWADFEHLYSGFVVTLTPQVRDFLADLAG